MWVKEGCKVLLVLIKLKTQAKNQAEGCVSGISIKEINRHTGIAIIKAKIWAHAS